MCMMEVLVPECKSRGGAKLLRIQNDNHCNSPPAPRRLDHKNSFLKYGFETFHPESKRAREEESKRARKQESKRAERAREQESKRTRTSKNEQHH